ncbi:MAG: putative metal-dependent hydrolase [Balneolaceae bacterium]|nr:putative metal-dependent hydrolase [Balneolaceae bacterium]
MQSEELEKLQYPVGKHQTPPSISSKDIEDWIEEIASFPILLKTEVETLSPEELKWKYRPGGWSIRQVIHHCADSHMNSFIRFKLTLTEDAPVIKAYLENRWAELPDSNQPDIKESLYIMEGLHSRWNLLLKNLSSKDLKRTFTHPETGKKISLKYNICLYAWHCRHHLAHVKQAKKVKDKYCC